MIRKTELLKKLDDPDYGIEDLILWAESLPDDVPQVDGYRDTALALALQLARSKVYEGDLKHFLYADGWQDALNHFESLMKNHAGSNEPGFDPKTTQDLSQKADVELFPVAFMYLERGFNEEVAIQKATAFIDLVRAEEARRAGKVDDKAEPEVLRTAVVSPMPNGYQVMFYLGNTVAGSARRFSNLTAQDQASHWEKHGVLPDDVVNQGGSGK